MLHFEYKVTELQLSYFISSIFFIVLVNDKLLIKFINNYKQQYTELNIKFEILKYFIVKHTPIIFFQIWEKNI